MGTGAVRVGALLGLSWLAACADTVDDSPHCLIYEVEAEIAYTGVPRADLLFVVDDSASMAEEQEHLRREIPSLVEQLVTGEGPSGPNWPARDLHVGIITADMGLPELPADSWPGCRDRGDDGRLDRVPSGCDEALPPFLEYFYRSDDANALTRDVACRAAPGTDGCGFSQPLEASLEALDPSPDTHNQGFLRDDFRFGYSAIHIVVVTDSDDCSIADDGFVNDALPDGNPRDPGLLCADHDDSLYDLERYVKGLRELRPGIESLVTFGAIAGVPVDRVDEEARSAVDSRDDASVAAYYDGILDDPRMRKRASAGAGLERVCSSDIATATPARRLVEMARDFGDGGQIVSICDSDWSPVLQPLIQALAEPDRSRFCLPRRFERDPSGLIESCLLLWELPGEADAHPETPTDCDDLDYLSPYENAPVNDRGGQTCVQRQLAVTDESGKPTPEPGEGWYYDDFSDGVAHSCARHLQQSMSFSENAFPYAGVIVKLSCQSTTYIVPDAGDLTCEDGNCPRGWSCNHDTDPPTCTPGECRVPG